MGDDVTAVAGVMHHPTFAHRAEYAALRGAVAAIERLSFSRAGSIGARIGGLGFAPLKIRRAVVERQLRSAFPERTADDIERIARASYAHLGRTSIETAILPSYSAAQIINLFESVNGWDLVEQRLALGKGLILVTGHLGNWELGGAYIAARGLPIDAVARHMANPLFDRYLTSTRERIGMTVVHDEQAVRRVPRSLRTGRAVAFLVDQGAVGLASTWVPFFGRFAKTPRGPAVFALRLDAPVVFGVALRQPSGRYQLNFEPIDISDKGDREADVDRIVADYTQVLERWIRRAPEQYLWHHRRWKHQRPGTPPELGDPLMHTP
jgi:Kdo2-lipid IVA lauroyltransferase/acyltransferase